MRDPAAAPCRPLTSASPSWLSGTPHRPRRTGTRPRCRRRCPEGGTHTRERSGRGAPPPPPPASRLTRPRPQPRGEPEPTPTAPHGRGQRPGPPPGYRERCGRARPRGGPGGRRRPPLPSARPLPAAAWPRPLASARPRHVTASRQSPGRGRRGRACALRGGDAEGEVEGRKLWGGKGEAL